MAVNLPTLTVCLLGTVILIRAATANTSASTPGASAASEPPPPQPDGSTADPDSATPISTEASSDSSATSDSSDSSATSATSTPSSSPPLEEPSEGLSPGEIAAITIGSIAGSAAVGGGIFAALKFTGKV
ncbi:osteocalcin 2a-like [Myripristis murdjan]|uniref:osteocalcin 2a-like n=1 Tax=Myripristis murdjan TaxID=586833 RepID=UPI001175E8E1|nr:osteocalcin 2a-like [Myripristis murdjan]